MVSNKKRRRFTFDELDQTGSPKAEKIIEDPLQQETAPFKLVQHDEYEEDILLSDIAPSPHQTRKKNLEPDNPKMLEFADNIKENGLINRIVVRPNPEYNPSGNDDINRYKYLLVAGERRKVAHEILGKETIPAKVQMNLTNDKIKAWAITVSENDQRESLSTSEKSEAVEQARIELNLSNKEIAEKLGYSEIRVIQLQGAKKLPQDLRDKLDENQKLTTRHIEAFKRLIGKHKLDTILVLDTDSDEIRTVKELVNLLLEEIIKRNLSGDVSQTIAREIITSKGKKTFLSEMSNKINDMVKRKLPNKLETNKLNLCLAQINNLKEKIEYIEKHLYNLKKGQSNSIPS